MMRPRGHSSEGTCRKSRGLGLTWAAPVREQSMMERSSLGGWGREQPGRVQSYSTKGEGRSREGTGTNVRSSTEAKADRPGRAPGLDQQGGVLGKSVWPRAVGVEARLHTARMWEVKTWREGAVSMILKKFPSGGEERDRGLSGGGETRIGEAGESREKHQITQEVWN